MKTVLIIFSVKIKYDYQFHEEFLKYGTFSMKLRRNVFFWYHSGEKDILELKKHINA